PCGGGPSRAGPPPAPGECRRAAPPAPRTGRRVRGDSAPLSPRPCARRPSPRRARLLATGPRVRSPRSSGNRTARPKPCQTPGRPPPAGARGGGAAPTVPEIFLAENSVGTPTNRHENRPTTAQVMSVSIGPRRFHLVNQEHGATNVSDLSTRLAY